MKLPNNVKVLRLNNQILDSQATMLKYNEHSQQYEEAKEAVERRKKAIRYLKESKLLVTWDQLKKKFKIGGI